MKILLYYACATILMMLLLYVLAFVRLPKQPKAPPKPVKPMTSEYSPGVYHGGRASGKKIQQVIHLLSVETGLPESTISKVITAMDKYMDIKTR